MKLAPFAKAEAAIGALLLALCVPLVLAGVGCRLVRTATEVPGEAIRAVAPEKRNNEAVNPVEVQQTLLRIADEFSDGMVLGVEKLRRGTNALDAAEALQWKSAIAMETCSIASGPNAIANLLDMTVFVTLARMTLEGYWQPRVFGESVVPMLETCRRFETNIWQVTNRVLKPEQQAELYQAIEAWHRREPLPQGILAARAVGFAARVAQANQADTTKPGGVLDLLNLDPLADLDPATREIAQTRLFGERALYVTQKMPLLLRWQTELLALNATRLPAVAELVTNSTQLTESIEHIARVAEQLPNVVSSEREEILKALESQEGKLSPLVNEVRQTLVAGTQMSTSLNTTVKTFDALMKRFGVGETNDAPPSATESEPFRIQDYGQTAVQMEAMARQLTALIQSLDQTLGSTNLATLTGQVTPAVQLAKASGKEIVDYAFRRCVLLIGIVFGAALVYRIMSARLVSAMRSVPSPPLGKRDQ